MSMGIEVYLKRGSATLVITKEYLENSPGSIRRNGSKEMVRYLMFQCLERKGKPVASGDLQDGGRKQRETSIFACPREVDDESSAGRRADMSGWTMGYLTSTLKAVPN